MSSGSRRRRQTLRRPPRRHDNAGLRRRLERLHREVTLKELKRRYGKSACFRCGTRKDLTIDHYYATEVGLVKELGYQGNTYLAEFPGCEHQGEEHA